MNYLIAALATLATTAYACVSGACVKGMCSDIPSNNQYYLTSFCDATVACGAFSGNCYEYFAADYARFGCKAIISCCQGTTKCVNLKVIDGGPGCSVEDKAHKQIIDASYATCKFFTNSTSCGWSDKILVTCKKTSATIDDTNDADSMIHSATNPTAKVPLGPCTYDLAFAGEKDVPLCHPTELDLFTRDYELFPRDDKLFNQ